MRKLVASNGTTFLYSPELGEVYVGRPKTGNDLRMNELDDVFLVKVPLEDIGELAALLRELGLIQGV